MGRRIVVYVILLGALIATGQVWLVTSLLSRPLPSGKTGWERLADARPSQQGRRVDMPFLTIGSPQSVRGCPTILPGEGVQIPVTTLAASDGGSYVLAATSLTYDSTPTTPSWTIPVGISTFIGSDTNPTVGSEDTVFYIWIFNGSNEIVETHEIPVDVDTTTKPSFPSFLQDIDDCDPLTYTARITVSRADSWSYRLLNDLGQEVFGGTPNTPDTSGCSFLAIVSGITGATQIEITATNANGSTTQTFGLTAPSEPHVSLSADPPGILEGQAVSLNWAATGALSVSIDNGVGVVWGGDWDDTPSGSVTVSPSETTTYTITAQGGCLTDTAQVTVTVQGVPAPGMASITWVAQEGIGSRKRARLTESAVLQWTAYDPSRTPQTARVLSRSVAHEEVRTSQTARVVARADVRGNMTSRVVSRATSVKPVTVRVLSRSRGFYPDRFHVKARNISTNTVTEWGVLDADTSPLTLSDVAIPAGTYMVWVEREGLFWKNARLASEMMVIIADGQPPVVLRLPMATNLAASISLGLTTITWDTSSDITDDGMLWGLWLDDAASIDTSGEPDASFVAFVGHTSFQSTIMQSSSQYIAVAAIGSDGTRGLSAELYLPWDTTAPTSPVNQVPIG